MTCLAASTRSKLLHRHALGTTALAIGLACGLASNPAHAIDLSATQVVPFDMSMSAGSATVMVPQFDDRFGNRTLQSVSFRLDVEVGGTASAENPDHFGYDDVAVELNANVTASVGGLLTILRYSTTFYADRPIGASDGAPGGPDSHDFGYLGLIDHGIDASATNLDAFVGQDLMAVSIDGVAAFLPHAEYEHWDWTFSDLNAGGEIEITYNWSEPAASTCPGDFDGNGAIDFSDLLNALSNWGSCELCPQDTSHDGMVGAAELFFLLSHWGPCP